MEKPAFWNHNAAYYPWIRKQLEGIAATRILDVGCGEGSLARYLAFPGREETAEQGVRRYYRNDNSLG